MNGYVAIWQSKRIEVVADTTFDAQCKAAIVFQQGTRRKVKGYDITVTLCEKDGEQVVHSTGGL